MWPDLHEITFTPVTKCSQGIQVSSDLLQEQPCTASAAGLNTVCVCVCVCVCVGGGGGVIKAFLRLLATGAPDAGNSLPAAHFSSHNNAAISGAGQCPKGTPCICIPFILSLQKSLFKMVAALMATNTVTHNLNTSLQKTKMSRTMVSGSLVMNHQWELFPVYFNSFGLWPSKANKKSLTTTVCTATDTQEFV